LSTSPAILAPPLSGATQYAAARTEKSVGKYGSGQRAQCRHASGFSPAATQSRRPSRCSGGTSLWHTAIPSGTGRQPGSGQLKPAPSAIWLCKSGIQGVATSDAASSPDTAQAEPWLDARRTQDRARA